MRSVFRVAALGASMLALTVGAAPFIAGAADHLDAPSLGSLTAGSVRGDRDINDVYVFQGANTSKTVIAVTTNPAAGVLAPTIYGTNVRYNINVDNNGDLRPDVTYTARFGPRGSGPDSKQALTLTRNGMVVSRGATGNTVQIGGTFRGKVFAGLRSDPFFFDLLGFRGSTGLGGRDRLCDSDPVDFFADLNTLGLVIEVPDAALGRHIGVWATTQELVNGSWVARDQMGCRRSTRCSTTPPPTRSCSTSRRPRTRLMPGSRSARTSPTPCRRSRRSTQRDPTRPPRPTPSRGC